MAWREYDFFVYILASRSHQLYIGFTNSLQRRLGEHRERRAGAYTTKYNIDRLVYYEHHQYVINAIAREKELKTFSRLKKIALIESINPTWRDLSEDWGKLVTAATSSLPHDGKSAAAKATAKATADSSAALRNDNKAGLRSRAITTGRGMPSEGK